MPIYLPLLAGQLDPNKCYASEQERLTDYAANLEAILSGQSFYNIGPDIPGPEFRGFPWLRTTDGRWYVYQGVWRTPHEFSPGRHLWEEFSNEADIWSFDGGDGSDPSTNPPTETTGAMWMLDPNYVGRSPMSPGVIPGSDPEKSLGYGENYGAGSHELTIDEMPEHDHPPKEGYDSFAGFVSAGQPSSFEIEGGSEINEMTVTGLRGGGNPHSLVHPVRGMCCIVRTGRIYRTVS